MKKKPYILMLEDKIEPTLAVINELSKRLGAGNFIFVALNTVKEAVECVDMVEKADVILAGRDECDLYGKLVDSFHRVIPLVMWGKCLSVSSTPRHNATAMELGARGVAWRCEDLDLFAEEVVEKILEIVKK